MKLKLLLKFIEKEFGPKKFKMVDNFQLLVMDLNHLKKKRKLKIVFFHNIKEKEHNFFFFFF